MRPSPPTAPIITTHPTNQSVAAGSTVTFTAAATGNPTPTVQWQSQVGSAAFADIAGATATSYTFTASAADDDRQFRAVFTNSAGTAASNAALLTMTSAPPTAPIITTHPANQMAAAGSTVTFTAAASGTPTPTVQWQSQVGSAAFADISGANQTYHNQTASASDDGRQFRAVFTNSAGTATTDAATLRILVAPTITLHPANQSVAAGSTVTFTAAASGTPTPTVQWQSQVGSAAFEDIAGATATSYTFTASAAGYGQQYRAVFTNLTGTATTNAAALTVSCVPGIAPRVTLHPQDFTMREDTGLCAGVRFHAARASARFHAAADGCAAAQWEVSTDNGLTWQPTGGSVSSADGSTSIGIEADCHVLGPPSGNKYRAVFSNSAGTATTNAATLTIVIQPRVRGHPSNQTVIAGSTATFTAAAVANTAMEVIWQKNRGGGQFQDVLRQSCPAACSTTYSFTAAASDNGGVYRASFWTNQGFGSAFTQTATLTVIAPPVITTHPASRTVTAGTTVTFSAAATGNPTPTVQWQVSTNGGASFTNISGATTGTYSFTATASDNGRQFRAVFTNLLNAVTTNAAVLTVN